MCLLVDSLPMSYLGSPEVIVQGHENQEVLIILGDACLKKQDIKKSHSIKYNT